MARLKREHPKHPPKKIGRKLKLIDWDLVDKLLMAGCDGMEIAPHFNMHYHTFYDRCAEEKGMPFTHYQAIKRSHGDSILRAKQFEKAVKGIGDNTMLVWLGKNRLKQRDREIVDVSDNQVVDELIDSLKKFKDANKPKEDIPAADPNATNQGQC